MPEHDGGGSISKDVARQDAWIAGHEATCTQRYEAILKAISANRAAVEKLTRQLIAIKKGLRAEMKTSDAAMQVRVGKVEREQTRQKNRQTYFVGVMAGASFMGSILGPIILKLLGVL